MFPLPKARDAISQVLTEEFAHPGVSVVIAARICIQERKRQKRLKKSAEENA